MSRLTAYFLAIVALVSCSHKELCYDHSHMAELNITFDWTEIPDAQPESMSLYLFDDDGTNFQRYELIGHQGATIRVSKGLYHALFLNSDTRNLECRERDHISTFWVATKDEELTGTYAVFSANIVETRKGEDRQNERLARQPEMLWSGSCNDIVVGDGENNVTLIPSQSVIRVTINIHNVQNLENISTITGTISGFAEGIILHSGERNEGCVTHPLDFDLLDDRTTMYSELYTFGDCLTGNGEHYVDLYATLRDGSQWKYTYDVTSQVHGGTDKLHINIVLDSLPVPEPSPGVGGGGFVPIIDGWNQINIGVEM